MIRYRVVSSKAGSTLYVDGLHLTPVKIVSNEGEEKGAYELLTEVAAYFNEVEKAISETSKLLEELLVACFRQEEVTLDLLMVGEKVARRLHYPGLQGFLNERLGGTELERKPK